MKAFITLIIVLLIGVGAYLLFFDEAPPEVVVDDAVVTYFQSEMNRRGVNDGFGMPIEGFDADLYISTFPGLTKQDFDRVETFEGHYEVVGGELTFERDVAQPVSTAERTLSEEGYETLLANLSSRLNIGVDTNAEVDDIIDTINTADVVSARLNATASVFEVGITPLVVLEDSRCPEDVQCIQAGTVRVRAEITSGGEEIIGILQLEQASTTPGGVITLMRVDPFTSSTHKITDNEYVFYFNVERRP